MLGTAWHGWGSLLVLVSLLGYFGGRGHYTSRVPFWTQLGDVVMGTAVALACDTFLTIAVYDRPVQLEGLLRWVFYCPFLLLFRTGVRELLRVCGVWSINTLIIAGRSVAEQARAALVSDPALGYELVGSLELATSRLSAIRNCSIFSTTIARTSWWSPSAAASRPRTLR